MILVVSHRFQCTTLLSNHTKPCCSRFGIKGTVIRQQGRGQNSRMPAKKGRRRWFLGWWTSCIVGIVDTKLDKIGYTLVLNVHNRVSPGLEKRSAVCTRKYTPNGLFVLFVCATHTAGLKPVFFLHSQPVELGGKRRGFNCIPEIVHTRAGYTRSLLLSLGIPRLLRLCISTDTQRCIGRSHVPYLSVESRTDISGLEPQ